MEHWYCLDLFSHSLTHSFIHSSYLLSAAMSQGLWMAAETEQYTKHTNSAALLSHSSWYLGCLSLQQRDPDSYGFGCSVSFLCCQLLPLTDTMSLHLIWVTIAGLFYIPGWSQLVYLRPTVCSLPFQAAPSFLLWIGGLPSFPFLNFLLGWLNSNDLIKLSGPKVSVTFFLERQSI